MSEYTDYREHRKQDDLKCLLEYIDRLDDGEVFSTPWSRPLTDSHEANIGAHCKSVTAVGLKLLATEIRRLQANG